MKKSLQIGLIYLINYFAVLGCVSEYTAELPLYETGILVVEGTILSNREVDFYFSKSIPLNSDISSAEYKNVKVDLYVVGSNGYRSLKATCWDEGLHRITLPELDENVSYGIEFEYEGETYRSELSIPQQTPPIDSVNWKQVEYEGDISLHVSLHNEGNEPVYLFWSLDEDYEITSFYRATLFIDERRDILYEDDSAPNYYCWKKSRNSKVIVGSTKALTENRLINHTIYKFQPSDERFHVLYSPLIRQRAISKAAYEYYLNKAQINQEVGGLFTPQPSELESNICCVTNSSKKVIGFVDVCMNIEEERLFISAEELTIPERIGNCNIIKMDEMVNNKEINELTYTQLRFHWKMNPVGTVLIDFKPTSIWADLECSDCREMGGTKNKPDFWLNDHQ